VHLVQFIIQTKNVQHIYINYIFDIVITPTCFNTSVLSSDCLVLVLCYSY